MIFITENAAKHIRRVKDDEGSTDANFLRVKVKKGGCSGMSYELDFDNSEAEDDRSFEDHGVKVVVDKDSFLYLINMTLDFEGGLNGQGFVFKNPNAKKSCSCGSSFAV